MGALAGLPPPAPNGKELESGSGLCGNGVPAVGSWGPCWRVEASPVLRDMVPLCMLLWAPAGTGWGWALGQCLLPGMTCWFRTGSNWQREGAAKWRKGDSEVGLAQSLHQEACSCQGAKASPPESLFLPPSCSDSTLTLCLFTFQPIGRPYQLYL